MLIQARNGELIEELEEHHTWRDEARFYYQLDPDSAATLNGYWKVVRVSGWGNFKAPFILD